MGDTEGVAVSAGLLTSRGGLVSHAAAVARGLGIPAVCGASELTIDRRARTVVVRLLDPPLHEFLPDVEELRIKEAQVRALLGAAASLRARGLDPRVETMVPLIATRGEGVWAVELMRRVAAAVEAEHGAPVPYTTATMIETPRAALRAAAIAPLVDACSFGTNDLSQLTFGFSRDDVSATYIPAALAGGLPDDDPFRTLDRHGVLRLVEIAVTEGRAAYPEPSTTA